MICGKTTARRGETTLRRGSPLACYLEMPTKQSPGAQPSRRLAAARSLFAAAHSRLAAACHWHATWKCQRNSRQAHSRFAVARSRFAAPGCLAAAHNRLGAARNRLIRVLVASSPLHNVQTGLIHFVVHGHSCKQRQSRRVRDCGCENERATALAQGANRLSRERRRT